MLPKLLQTGHWPYYLDLMRVDRPVGWLLLLWPTMWALWLAGEGQPDIALVVVFGLGVFVMRSAGCVINDLADRDIDPAVTRTRLRPLAAGQVAPGEALTLFGVLMAIALALVLTTNWLTVGLACAGALLAATYPLFKRFTYFPQLILGLAFSWSIPMAYAAQTESLPPLCWLLFTANVVWTVAYDTIYAMVDRTDDLKVGVKSTAILFGDLDKLMVGILQATFVLALWLVGQRAELGAWFYASVAVAGALFLRQQWLIRNRNPAPCFEAFLNNQWIGGVVFLGLVVDMAVSGWG